MAIHTTLAPVQQPLSPTLQLPLEEEAEGSPTPHAVPPLAVEDTSRLTGLTKSVDDKAVSLAPAPEASAPETAETLGLTKSVADKPTPPPLTPAQRQEKAQQEQAQRETYWSQFEDPHRLDQEDLTYQKVDAITPGAGQTLRQREMMIRFLVQKYPGNETHIRQNPDLYAQDYGSREWHAEQPLDTPRFFARAQQDVRQEKAAYQLLRGSGGQDEGLIGSAYKAALFNDKEGFRHWLDKAKVHPGYQPNHEGDYLETWNGVRKQVDADMGTQRGLLNTLYLQLLGQTGLEDSLRTRVAAYAHAERDLTRLAQHHPQAYTHVKNMLIEMASRAPHEAKEGISGWLQKKR